jgi:hypothetical protein
MMTIRKVSTFTKSDGSHYFQYEKLTTIEGARQFFTTVKRYGHLDFYFTGGFTKGVEAWADESWRCGPQYQNQGVNGWNMVNSGLGLPYVILDFHPEHTLRKEDSNHDN